MEPPRYWSRGVTETLPGLEVVIPAYNEAERLHLGLRTLTQRLGTLPYPCSVVVVDNASTDGTARIARSWSSGSGPGGGPGNVPVRLISCPQPGKGAAVRAGLLATSAPLVGFCDADMATDLGVLERTVALLAGGHPVVVGSREHHDSVVGGRDSLARGLGAIAFRAVARRVLPDVADTQCGFKFFLGSVGRTAARRLRCTGFAFDVELLAHCQRLGASVTEVPVWWQDVPGSRFSPLRHGLGSVREALRIRGTVRRQPLPPNGVPSCPVTTGVPAAYVSVRAHVPLQRQPEPSPQPAAALRHSATVGESGRR